MSLSEYAETVEELVDAMNSRLDAFDDRIAVQPTVPLLQESIRDRIEARYEFVEQFGSLDPPDEVEELHALALDIMSRLADAEARLGEMAEAAQSVADIEGLWSTREGLEARAIDQEALAICAAAQEGFDATQAREEFSDLPWIPPEMREVVSVTFRCQRDDGD